MPVLRRRTSRLVFTAYLAWTLTTLVLAIVALSHRPETRLPALVGWIGIAVVGQRASGERFSAASFAFMAALTLPVACTFVAAYEAHARWEISMSWGLAAVAVALGLCATIFLRAMIASGSADYPYDE